MNETEAKNVVVLQCEWPRNSTDHNEKWINFHGFQCVQILSALQLSQLTSGSITAVCVWKSIVAATNEHQDSWRVQNGEGRVISVYV